MEDSERPNLVEEIAENNEKTNGNILANIEGKVNGDSKDLKEEIEDVKVWLYFKNHYITIAACHHATHVKVLFVLTKK